MEYVKQFPNAEGGLLMENMNKIYNYCSQQ